MSLSTTSTWHLNTIKELVRAPSLLHTIWSTVPLHYAKYCMISVYKNTHSVTEPHSPVSSGHNHKMSSVYVQRNFWSLQSCCAISILSYKEDKKERKKKARQISMAEKNDNGIASVLGVWEGAHWEKGRENHETETCTNDQVKKQHKMERTAEKYSWGNNTQLNWGTKHLKVNSSQKGKFILCVHDNTHHQTFSWHDKFCVF